MVLGERDIDQHAVVVRSVPHALFAKSGERAVAQHRLDGFAVRDIAPQVAQWQAGFDAKADLREKFSRLGDAVEKPAELISRTLEFIGLITKE